MNSGIETLSERERETLRLLLRGHDAKSIARDLGLSVHTVNDRLRDVRKKLGVSSSREAARLLAEAEQTPDNLGGKNFGVAGEAGGMLPTGGSKQVRGANRTWLIGGILLMWLIIAVLLSSALGPSEGSSPAVAAASAGASAQAAQSPAAKSAQAWVVLVDRQQWEESWKQAGTMFKSQVTAAGWTAAAKPVRDQVGTVARRTLKSATKHSSLPGAPAGEYEIVEFNTAFTKAKSTVETVVLAREASGWKVVGYFVKPA